MCKEFMYLFSFLEGMCKLAMYAGEVTCYNYLVHFYPVLPPRISEQLPQFFLPHFFSFTAFLRGWFGWDNMTRPKSPSKLHVRVGIWNQDSQILVNYSNYYNGSQMFYCRHGGCAQRFMFLHHAHPQAMHEPGVRNMYLSLMFRLKEQALKIYAEV